MRILILNLSEESSAAVEAALAGQGYEVVKKQGLTVEEVLSVSPEVLITEATPSDLSCCGLITQLKARPETEMPLKIVMVVRGGAMERARALDLGADDVLSYPFDAVEFAARIRTQFRERAPEEEVRTMLKYAVQREHYADVAVESLSAEPGVKHRSFFFLAIMVLGAAAIMATVVALVSLRHSSKDTLQLRAEIARLNNGLGEQKEFLRRAETVRTDLAKNSAETTEASLRAKSEDLRKRVAKADASEADSLKQQLADTQKRLKLLETEGKIAETVVRNYAPSICLLHVVVEFVDKKTGRPIRIALGSDGKPDVDKDGMVQLDIEGAGPLLRVDVFGTGFLVSHDGEILTNHHVVEPWWKSDDIKPLVDHGATAFVSSYEAYFPGKTQGLSGKLLRISKTADVAILKLDSPPADATVLKLDDHNSASVVGDPVVLIGYPTGIEGILARAGADVAEKIAGNTDDVGKIMSQLAAQKLIRPTTTQGHLGDVLADKLVYDAATTSGGSGGPVFNREGNVIGVNFAMLNGFGGSNLAVPAKYAIDLMQQ